LNKISIETLDIYKQQNKGNKMRKIAMLIGIVSILSLGSAANAGYWKHTPSFGSNGYTSTYYPTFNVWTGKFD